MADNYRVRIDARQGLVKGINDIIPSNKSKIINSIQKQDGVFYGSLRPTDGMTGPQWIKHLEKKGCKVGMVPREALLSTEFKPTSGVIYQIAIFRTSMLEKKKEQRCGKFMPDVQAKAKELNLWELNAEAACIILDMLTDLKNKDLGFSLTVMSTPFTDNFAGKNRKYYLTVDGDWLSDMIDDDSTYDMTVSGGDGIPYLGVDQMCFVFSAVNTSVMTVSEGNSVHYLDANQKKISDNKS